jgi:hypothetical protein
MLQTSEHDGRIVADIVAEWAQNHSQPFVLRLDSVAGSTFTQGQAGQAVSLDAIEFGRIPWGRAQRNGLFSSQVLF